MFAVYISVGLAILSGVIVIVDGLIASRRIDPPKRAERGRWPD